MQLARFKADNTVLTAPVLPILALTELTYVKKNCVIQSFFIYLQRDLYILRIKTSNIE